MSLEAIKTINEAEEKAKKLKTDAVADAKKAVKDAESKGLAEIEAAVKKADDELKELIRKADAKAAEDAEKLSGDTETKKAVMRARAEKMVEKAALLVVERIVNG